jgi:hypothetical protein
MMTVCEGPRQPSQHRATLLRRELEPPERRRPPFAGTVTGFSPPILEFRDAHLARPVPK